MLDDSISVETWDFTKGLQKKGSKSIKKYSSIKTGLILKNKVEIDENF